MKKICTIILILAGITYSYAQSKIEGYEYWFNNDFANKTTTNVAPTQQLLVNQSVSVTGLTSGVHTFNFRSFDDKGKYSAVISSFFYKPSALESSPNPEITAYEYWVDNSYGDAVLVNTAAQQQLSIDELISMSSLPNGIHVFNIRFKDSRGLWSSTTSEFFYKMPPPAPGSSNLVSYEYWFDNDYQNAVTANTPVQSPVVINEMVDAQTLPAGIHIFNIRFKDDRGLWSSTTSEFFYKMAAQSVTNNLIVGYRYWLNDDFENATVEALETPVKQFSLIDNLDFTSIPKGDYTISFQFKDTLGLWSSVTTDSIAKVSLPISNFTYTTQVECDSTIAYFTNLSVDADDYLWEFGDGNSSTLANPIHTYYTPSTYQVSLTVTDTLMGTDSTMVLPMEIISLNTDSTITATACDSYTAPDGEVYTTSGIKTAVIPNAAGCDSTITIDLTIINVDVSVTQDGITLTANATDASYQWLDCDNDYSAIAGETEQSFTATQNGNYAVEVTQDICVATSDCFAVTGVGVIENTFANEIIVYPNPTRDIVKVDLGKVLDEFTVIINDVNGKLVRKSTYKDTQTLELNLDVQPGIYLMTISSGDKKVTIKLIKN